MLLNPVEMWCLWTTHGERSHLRNHDCISGVTVRLITPLGAKCGGAGTSVSELSAAPTLFSWPELEDWQRYSHVAAIAWNACHTIIAPSFIPPDTAGGAFNCSFGPCKCQMDTAAAHGRFGLMMLI